jgi:hypothetical protein
MKKRRNNSNRASTLWIALSTGLVSISAILLAIAPPINTKKAPGHHLSGFQLVEGAAADSITALGNYPDTSIPLSTQRRSGGHAQPHCPSEPRFYIQRKFL